MATIHVIFGGIGSGKSTYACGLLDVDRTFKIGLRTSPMQLLYTLRADIGRSHEVKNRQMGLRFKASSVDSLASDIASATDPVLLIDEWTTLFTHMVLWDTAHIKRYIQTVFSAIGRNHFIDEVIIVTTEHYGPILFRLYKKAGMMNALLFAEADTITKVYYGVPLVVLGEQ